MQVELDRHAHAGPEFEVAVRSQVRRFNHVQPDRKANAAQPLGTRHAALRRSHGVHLDQQGARDRARGNAGVDGRNDRLQRPVAGDGRAFPFRVGSGHRNGGAAGVAAASDGRAEIQHDAIAALDLAFHCMPGRALGVRTRHDNRCRVDVGILLARNVLRRTGDLNFRHPDLDQLHRLSKRLVIDRGRGVHAGKAGRPRSGDAQFGRSAADTAKFISSPRGSWPTCQFELLKRSLDHSTRGALAVAAAASADRTDGLDRLRRSGVACGGCPGPVCASPSLPGVSRRTSPCREGEGGRGAAHRSRPPSASGSRVSGCRLPRFGPACPRARPAGNPAKAPMRDRAAPRCRSRPGDQAVKLLAPETMIESCLPRGRPVSGRTDQVRTRETGRGVELVPDRAHRTHELNRTAPASRSMGECCRCPWRHSDWPRSAGAGVTARALVIASGSPGRDKESGSASTVTKCSH